MLVQITVGTLLMLLTLASSGASLYVIEVMLQAARPWVLGGRVWAKLVAVIMMVSVWALVDLTLGVWIWAMAYWRLGAFPDLEHAVYFSLVSFTTLGYGDLLLPQEWRIMGGLTAASGLLNFGLITAILVETVRDVRVAQLRHQTRQDARHEVRRARR